MPRFVLLLLFALIPGCATYQFDIIQPPTPDRQIRDDQPTRLPIDPLEYRLQADEGRLVMLIFNPTPDPIELLGNKSTVVDPDGHSHPLRDQTIAPGSFVKEIFPPMRLFQDPSGPTWHFGVGTIIGAADPPAYGPYPTLMDAAGDPGIYFWDWQGESEVRMTLVYEREDSTFSHFLVFHRVKR